MVHLSFRQQNQHLTVKEGIKDKLETREQIKQGSGQPQNSTSGTDSTEFVSFEKNMIFS